METEDPRRDLLKGDVALRAAAARDLALVGTWDDVGQLVELAWTDKSTSVRLYSAAAAADIVSRHRGAPGKASMTPSERKQAFSWAFGGDPGRNPSMLMVASALEDSRTLARLGRILRDPRSDVRFGATTALRRMCLSALSRPDQVGPALSEWITDARVPTSATLELLKLVGEAGLFLAEEAVRDTVGSTQGLEQGRALALDRLTMRRDASAWRGLYVCDGRDVFENATPGETHLGVHAGESWSTADGGGAFALEDGVGRVDGEAARMVWAIPMGQTDARRALQVGGRTWWAVEGKELAKLVTERWFDLQQLSVEAAAATRDALVEVDGVVAERGAMICQWLSGDHEGALATLEPWLSKARPRADLHWWRARVLVDLGRGADAVADLEEYLERAKKGAPLVERATALLKSLRS